MGQQEMLIDGLRPKSDVIDVAFLTQLQKKGGVNIPSLPSLWDLAVGAVQNSVGRPQKVAERGRGSAPPFSS